MSDKYLNEEPQTIEKTIERMRVSVTIQPSATVGHAERLQSALLRNRRPTANHMAKIIRLPDR